MFNFMILEMGLASELTLGWGRTIVTERNLRPGEWY